MSSAIDALIRSNGWNLRDIKGRIEFETQDQLCISLENTKTKERTFYEFDDRTVHRGVQLDRDGNVVAEPTLRESALYIAMNFGKLEQQALETHAKEPPKQLRNADV